MPVYPSEKAQKTSSVENEWVKVKLGDICSYDLGKTPERDNPAYWKKEEGSVPWVKIADMSEHCVITETSEKISELAFHEVFRGRIVPAGTLLMSFKLTIGRIAYLGIPACHNEAIISIYPKEGVDKYYLGYFLSQVNYSGIFDRAVKGNTLNKGKIDRIPILLPPLPEQKQISAILWTIEKAIALERQCEESLTTIKRAAMHVVFNPANKVGWEYYPLEEVFTTRQGYTPKTSEASYWKNGTIPFVTMEDIRKYGQRLEKAHRYVTEVVIKGSGVFPAGSFIISTSATIGEHALITVPFLTNQRFTCLILKPAFEKRLERDFIFYYLYTLGQWCRRHVNIGTKFKEVQMSDFRKFSFPIPPLHEQQEIVDFLTTLDQKLDIHRRKRACLENIFRLFLPNLTRGTLRFTELPEGCF